MSLILIAHHDKDTRLTLRQLFKQEGYRVIESEDAEQCLAACQTWPVDMVLLDAALPLLDGFETCQRLRTIPRCVTLPLLMIVPDDLDAIDRAFTVGADDCIVEPLHWTMLRKRIARMIGRQQAIQSDQMAWYRSLFEQAREGVFRSTTDGRLLEVNMALVTMLGYTTKEELYALRLPDDLYVNPSERRHLRESYDAGGVVKNAELRWKKKDGTPIWVNLNAIATRDESGEIRHYEGMVTEITESLRIEETLRAIVEGTAAVTGSDYYRLLVQYLATVLKASYAFVGELVTPDDVQTLAFWSKGEQRRNFRYTLAGTPCRTVVDREMAYYPRNVQTLFPDDIGLVNMNVESYLGIPLFDAAGKPLGLLVVMHDEELDTLIEIKPILEIFAARTSTEIERQRAQMALQYRVDFEAIVNSISTMFINLPLAEIDRGIQTLLQTAGESISADRGYVFLYDDPTRTSLDNPYEWCARGIEPRTPWLKNFPHQNFRWFDSRLAQRQPFTIHVADLPPEASSEARALELHHVQFGIYVPLIYGEDILGFLGFDSIRLYQPWPDNIGSLLWIAGEILTNALRRKQAEEAERRQRLLTEAITSSAIQLNRSLDLEAILDGILEQVSRVVAYDIADVALIEDGMYRVVRCNHCESEELRAMRMEIRLPVATTANLRQMVETRQPVIIPDIQDDPAWVFADRAVDDHGYIGVPIQLDQEVIGFLSLFSYEVGAFTQAQAELLQVFAMQVGSAIRNAWLYDAVQRHASEMEQRVLERTVEIEQQRKHMQAILDSMDEGVMGALFYEGYVPRMRYVNPALYRLLGYHAEEWNIFKMRSETMSVKDFEQILQDVEDALTENRMWYGELRMRHKDGHEFEAAITLTRIDTGELSDSRPSRVMIVRDISQAKTLAAQKSRFVANAAHELRTPITNLKTRLYLAAHQPDEIRTHLAVIEKVTDDMRDLIEKLLDLSRFEHGIIELEKSLSTVQALIARVSLVQTVEAEMRGITLEIIMPETPLTIEVDTVRITQVLTNLVTNAIHHTPSGGKITISAGAENDTVLIGIQDTGTGISAEHLPYLFEPFFQVSRRGGGMGLGLSIAKEIVNLHGGEITVYSVVGEGTCFSVRLQLAAQSQIAIADAIRGR